MGEHTRPAPAPAGGLAGRLPPPGKGGGGGGPPPPIPGIGGGGGGGGGGALMAAQLVVCSKCLLFTVRSGSSIAWAALYSSSLMRKVS